VNRGDEAHSSNQIGRDGENDTSGQGDEAVDDEQRA